MGISVLFPFFLLAGCAVAGADTVGYWKFDNTNVGTAIDQNVGFQDSSASGLTGILGAAVQFTWFGAGAVWLGGGFGLIAGWEACLIVDDSDAELLNILAPPMTLEAWIRADEMQDGHIGLVSYGVPGGRDGRGGWKLGLNNGDLLFTTFGVVDVYSSVPFPYDGAWHHIAAVYSDVDAWVLFYIDGEELGVVEESRALLDPSSKELNIGAQYTSIGRFSGGY